ncbi:MAG: aminopeptidase P family protein [Hyphomicrobiaceae bacterium]|nr:aminopeptidase P family protein [Hyphomicrobiaceae bacterium]
MTLLFSRDEYDARLGKLRAAMAEKKLDAMMLFAQESMVWLTGYDTFGFCFFQTLIVRADGKMVLITRAPDLRQAQQTSILEDIRVWTDGKRGRGFEQVKSVLDELDLLGATIGIEYDTHGLTAANGRLLDTALTGFAETEDASFLIARLRMIKSFAEIAYVREAAENADAALEAARPLIRPGASEGEILAALQGEVFRRGGGYPGNGFIVGSGEAALLCRTRNARRTLDENDQLTLEWAGTAAGYHAALMRTLVIGQPTPRHLELYDAARAALGAVEKVLCPGHSFSDVFEAHRRVLDARGLHAHRFNACGYSLGTRYAPSWMDHPMFHEGSDVAIAPNMTLFAHMILMDSDTGTAMTLGRTYLTTEGDPEPLSGLPLDLEVIA